MIRIIVFGGFGCIYWGSTKSRQPMRKYGAIVNTASCAGLGCPTMMTGYATSMLAALG